MSVIGMPEIRLTKELYEKQDEPGKPKNYGWLRRNRKPVISTVCGVALTFAGTYMTSNYLNKPVSIHAMPDENGVTKYLVVRSDWRTKIFSYQDGSKKYISLDEEQKNTVRDLEKKQEADKRTLEKKAETIQ